MVLCFGFVTKIVLVK